MLTSAPAPRRARPSRYARILSRWHHKRPFPCVIHAFPTHQSGLKSGTFNPSLGDVVPDRGTAKATSSWVSGQLWVTRPSWATQHARLLRRWRRRWLSSRLPARSPRGCTQVTINRTSRHIMQHIGCTIMCTNARIIDDEMTMGAGLLGHTTENRAVHSTSSIG